LAERELARGTGDPGAVLLEAHLAISDIRVFGNGAGARPATPAALAARRDTDERDATITWQPARVS